MQQFDALFCIVHTHPQAELSEKGFRKLASNSTKTVANLFRRLFSKSRSSYPAIKGVTLINGLRYITAIDDVVRREIGSVPAEIRRDTLSLYISALRITARGLESLLGDHEEGGLL